MPQVRALPNILGKHIGSNVNSRTVPASSRFCPHMAFVVSCPFMTGIRIINT